MKTNSLTAQISTGIALALLSFGTGLGRAATATPLQTTGDQFTQASPFQNVAWEENKFEKLRHAYHLLEHADGDYSGHREAAMKSIRRAAETVGADLHKGEGHAEESQWNSDRRLHEARHLLEDLVAEGNGKEQPNIHRAIKELDKALATK